MEHEGSLPHSQVPATCPYPEPDQCSPYPHFLLPKDPSYYYPPIYAWFSQVFSFPQVSPPKSWCYTKYTVFLRQKTYFFTLSVLHYNNFLSNLFKNFEIYVLLKFIIEILLVSNKNSGQMEVPYMRVSQMKALNL